LLDDLKHSNQEKHANQRIFIINIENYAYLAPYIETDEEIFLKTVISSHTLRSRQTVAPVAAAHGLDVHEYPSLGSIIDGHTIGDASPSELATGPLAEAIEKLPLGSLVLVSGNSNNLFAIMNRLGVPSANEGNSCSKGLACVPCIDNSCFPVGFDSLWVLILGGAPELHQLIWLKY
jgi:hypothetical protein